MRITPDAPRPLWYWHRFMQKKLRLWTSITLPQSERLRVRFLGEGRHRLVMEIAGEERLLKILRAQYYDLTLPIGTAATIDNCQHLNSLADLHISPRCDHIAGGAFRVDHAGEVIAPGVISDRAIVEDVFSRLRQWSIQTGMVILDYNEGNWCVRDGRLQFVDFDMQYTCLFSELKTNEVICKRIDTAKMEDPEAMLDAFLEIEAGLLWSFLCGIELPPS